MPGSMKIKRVGTLIKKGEFASSADWRTIGESALDAVAAADWPPGSGSFTIYPESGKKRDEGNGVIPIKLNAIKKLTGGKPPYGKLIKERLRQRLNSPLIDEWVAEYPWPVGERIRPGNMDATFGMADGLVCFEWETGNISSSHPLMNKMCLGLLKGTLKAGLLVVPSRDLYTLLTDRVGNIVELEPYFPLWRDTPCNEGVLEVVVIEHDAVSRDVPRIPKITAGRALG